MSERFWRLAPWLTRVPLAIFTAFTVFLGVRYVAHPEGVVSDFGLTAGSAAALTNMRGAGAVQFALAAVALWCLVRGHVLPGLQLVTAVLAVAFVTRCLILLLDGSTPLLARILPVELGLLALVGAALAVETVRTRRTPASRS